MKFSLKPLKHVASLNDEVLSETTSPGSLIRYTEVSDVKQGAPIQWKEAIPFAAAPSRARRIPRHGDILVSTVRTYLRAVTQVQHPPHGAVASTGFAVVRTRTGDPRYLGYALQAAEFIDDVVARSVGVSYPAISSTEIGRIRVPSPPTAAQRAIADYLDHETAEIDALIDEQDRLLNLLSERSTSLVEKVTTQGLGDWSLSRTDLEWPSEVPSHWNVQRTSWLFGSIGSGTTPRSDDGDAFIGEIPWVTSSELRERGISETDRLLSEGALSRYSSLHRYPAGSILIAMYGATIGRLGWLDVPATVNQAVCVFSHYRPGPSSFAYYGLLAAKRHLLTLASGGGQPNINQEKLRSLRLPVPPPSEQQEIVDYLKEVQKTTVELELEAAKLIDVARERRAALISAAVTGQIDVTIRHRPVAEVLEDEVREMV